MKINMLKKNKLLLFFLAFVFLISVTSRGAYSYFTYEQTYSSSNSKVSVEYVPIHNLTIIIDSKLNSMSSQEETGFTEVNGFKNLVPMNNGKKYQRVPYASYSSQLKYNCSKVYVYKGTYEESNSSSKTCSIKFEITHSKTTGGIRNIHIPTWDDVSESEYSRSYYFDSDHFDVIQSGGTQGSPSVIVKEDMNGNVTIIIRIITINY